MRCKICNSEDVVFYSKLVFFDIVKCNFCGVKFAGKFPIEKKIKDLYSEKYYSPWTNERGVIPKSVELMKKMTFGSYLNLLSKYVSLKGKKLLDVGCATGFLLDTAKKVGSDCWGVELNPFGAKESLKKFPNKIFNGILEDSKFSNGFFNIVTMIDLIEHTQNPLAVMKEARRIMKSGGYILIVTPNVGGLWSKILGKKWTNYKEEHLFYFDERSLRWLVEKVGLRYVYGKPACKALTLRYIYGQLEQYKTPVLTGFSRLFKLLPTSVLDKPFFIRTGDYLAVAKI